MMKKRILTTVCFIAIASISFSQMTKDSLIKMMANEVCDEFSKKEIVFKNFDDLQREFGMIIMPIFFKHSNEIEEFGNPAFSDRENMRNLGGLIAEQCQKNCLSYRKLIMNNPEAIKLAKEEYEKKQLKVYGTLIKIVMSERSYLEIKTETGDIVKMWVIESIDNFNDLMTNQDKWLNKKVKVLYAEPRDGDNSSKVYSNEKVLIDVSLN